MAAPARGAIKITSVKALQLDFQTDGCLVRIETDAGITGYGETGVDARMARARIPQYAPGGRGPAVHRAPFPDHDRRDSSLPAARSP